MNYRLQDLIDMEHFQNLQDRLNEIYSFPSSIIDNDGNVLTATAWQDICTQFHRKNIDSEKLCIKSDQYIKDHLHEANPAVSYRCPHGLVDNAAPIIIDGIHYGNFFTGQFFFDKPDMAFFRAQAKKYGFDEDAYLKAVKRVPVWTKEQLNSYLFFIKGLITVISESGLKKLREIENRKLIEASEKKHRSILKSAMDGYWLTDAEGRLIEVNETYCRMSGYSEDELLTMRIPDLEALENAQIVAERMQKVIHQGSFRFETKHRNKNGTVFDVEISTQFRSEENGQCVCFLRDITDRKKVEKALKESEERFKALHNASFGGIAIHNKGIILECNQGLSEISGYEYHELIGMDVLSLISDETRDKVIQNINAGYEMPYEAEGVRKNDELYPLRLEARNIPYKGKKARVVEFRDITESKRAQAENENLEGQLRQAQKMEAVGRLAGGVAHDFNNMLSVIIGNASMALEEMDLAQPLRDSFEEIKKAGERSSDLTRQLLAFARKQTVTPEVLDLSKAVGGMVTMLQRLIGEDIALAWLPGEKVWPVKIDPSQVHQILVNLCVNARDAIADVGKVTIETGNEIIDEADCIDHARLLPGEYVLLAISDDGCGMDTETLAHVFEPFFTTKEAGKGTGLGLATVYGVVKQNNGFVSVYSEPDHGTTFKVYLPRHRVKTARLPEQIGDKLAECGHGYETILLVEDEPSILRVITMMLERQGYTVMQAQTPGEAIRLAQEHAGEIHLLLTDVVMPEMNGRDLAKTILPYYPNLKRLFMSGYTANVIAHHGVLDKGLNFIHKPFSRGSLCAKVREALDEGMVKS